MELVKKRNTFLEITKGIVSAFLFTVICLIIFACLLSYTSLSENTISPVTIGITGVSSILGGIIGSKNIKKNGLIKGAIIGIFYMIMMYLIAGIVSKGDFSINIRKMIMCLSSMFGGMIGGVIGINLKRI